MKSYIIKIKEKKLFLILMIIGFLVFNFDSTFALQIKNVYFGENVSDRWIEVFNDGNDIADFTSTDYRLIDNTSESKRTIIEVLGGKAFPSNSTAYIYKTLSPSTEISESLPINAGLVFRSSFVLNENSGYVQIATNDLSTIYTCYSYGGMVCPSGSNNTNASSTNSTTTSTSTDIDNDDTNEAIKYIYVPVNNQNIYGDIKVLLPTDEVVPAGADVLYTLKALDSNGLVIPGLNFHWSFGDGGERFGKDVYYHYVYPGEYTLIASADGYRSGGQARMSVKVVNPNIKIVRIGTGENDNMIDIENDTDYDLFLSDFYLQLDGRFYKLPKDLLLAKNKIIHLSGEALDFILPTNNASLLYPNKKILTSFDFNVNSNPTSSSSLLLDFLNASSSSTTLFNLSKTPSTSINLTDTENSIENNSKNFYQPENYLIKENKLIPSDNKIIYSKSYSSENINEDSLMDDKQNMEENNLVLKRLILDTDLKESDNLDNKNDLYISEANKEQNNTENGDNSNKSEDTDIGILNWLKNLLY